MKTIRLMSEADALREFDCMLDDCNEPYFLGYLEFSPSEILKKLDPVAYRCDFIAYCDMMAEDEVFLVEGYTEDYSYDV
jgi:hypothetical protein